MRHDVWLLQRSKVAGGTQRIIEELAIRLHESGVEARAVFLRDLDEHRRAQNSKVDAMLAHFRDLWRLLSGLWQEKPSVIVTFTPLLGALVGLLTKVPGRYRVVSTLHTPSHNIGRTALRADRLAAWSGSYIKVVACGRAVAESYSIGRVPYPIDIEVIQNGVPPIHARRSPGEDKALRALAGIPEGLSVAFAAGRLAEQKNYPFLIRALSATEDWFLVIAGDGADRDKIESEITRLGVSTRVRLLGLIGPEKVARWLAECDAYVLPSTNEGLSLALLEAMASGAPIVASDIPGNREALGDMVGEFGWVLQGADETAWSSVLRKLRANPEIGEAAGARARIRQHALFSEERMYDEYVQLIRDVLAG